VKKTSSDLSDEEHTYDLLKNEPSSFSDVTRKLDNYAYLKQKYGK